MLNFKVFTIFPDLFPGCLNSSVTGVALSKNLWQIQAINIRDYALDKHKTVDDLVFGGGSGMLFKPDVIANALESNLSFLGQQNKYKNSKKILYLSPRGKLFNQELANDLAGLNEIAILCGRYEGVDQRVLDEFAIEEISMGNYVLSGGEVAAFPFIDAIVRNIPGVLGDFDSLHEESFGSNQNKSFKNLLEYDQYTRPREWRNRKVPDVLLSGNHQKIKEWRLKSAKETTNKNRPDLLYYTNSHLKKHI